MFVGKRMRPVFIVIVVARLKKKKKKTKRKLYEASSINHESAPQNVSFTVTTLPQRLHHPPKARTVVC